MKRKASKPEKPTGSMQALQEMMSNVPGVMYQFFARKDGSMGLHFVSDQARRLFGLEPDSDDFFERFTDRVVPEHRTMFTSSIRRAVKDAAEWNYEGRFRKDSGEIMWFQGHSSPVKYKEEILFNGVLTDITARKEMEESLRRSEADYRRVIENIQDVYYRSDKSGNLIMTSPSFIKLLGYDSLDECLGRPIAEVYYFNPEKRVEFLKEIYANGHVSSYEVVLKRRDGTPVTVETSSNVFYDDSGEVAGVEGIFRDVTERKRSEEALKESEERFRQVSENAGEWIWEVDHEGLYAYSSPVVERILGYKPEEIVYRKYFYDFFIPHMKENLKKSALGAFSRKEAFKGFIHQNVHKDGSIVILETNGSPVINDKGDLVGYRGVDADITERKRSESELRIFMESVQNSSDAVGMSTPEGRHYYQNRAFDSLFGPIGDNPPETVYVDKEIGHEIFGTIMAGGQWTGEVKMYSIDRSVLTILLRAYASRDDSGHITALVGVHTDITEKKRAEEALRQSERLMEMIVDGSPIPQFVIDKDHRIIHWNRALEEYSSIRAGDVIGTNQHWRAFYNRERPCMADLLVDDLVDQMTRWYGGNCTPSRLIEGAYEATGFFADMKGGTWLDFTAAPIKDENGKIIGAVETLADVTMRNQAEDASIASKNYLDKIINSVGDPIFVKDRQHRWMLINDAFCVFMGYERGELIGRSDYEFVPRSEADVFWAVDEIVFRTGEENVNEESITDVRGVVHTISTKKTLYRNEKGEDFIVGIIRDVSEKKEAENRLRSAYRQLENIIEFLPDATFIIDEEKRIIAWNRAMQEITGVSKEEILGKDHIYSAVPFYGKPRQHLIDLLYISDDELGSKYDFVKKKGDALYAEVFTPALFGGRGAYVWAIASPLYGSDGNVSGAIESIRDISDRKEVEAALRQSEERYRLLFGHSPVGIVHIDGNGTILNVNEKWGEIIGGPPDAFIGFNFVDRIVNPDICAVIAKVLEGKPSYFEGEDESVKTGMVSFLQFICQPLFTQDGNVSGAICICQDVTQRVKIEAALRDSLREKDILLKEIHHRVKNNLNVIVSLLGLQMNREKSEEVRYSLNITRSRIYAIALIHELLYQMDNLSRIDFRKYILKLVSQLHGVLTEETRNIKETISIQSISLDIEKAVPCGILVSEILTNAYKHAFSGRDSGTIVIEMSCIEGGYRLNIGDDGIGLPEGIKLREGSSLGLELIRVLVENQLRGRLRYWNDNGLKYSILLPEDPVRGFQGS
ncbi:MAG: PAS domain S-box protein [Spirochaetes bacterium]|nr:PAS domain S-box protein [Spirochaetota bacterium]